ncbi:MAG: DUF1501 domain-containing protein [Kofleriaceae bacterium]
MRRRDFLSASLFGAGALACLPALRRRAHAAPGPSARADRVLILNLTGGIRSSAAVHASADVAYNPWGLMAGVSSPFALGAILDDGGAPASYTLGPAWGGAMVPSLRDSAGAFSVLGTYAMTRGDHLRARIEEPTGSASGGDPGILTRIGAGLAAAQTPTGAPAFHVAPAARFGAGLGPLSTFVPVSLASAASVPSSSSVLPQWVSDTGNGFATDDAMRDRLDLPALADRHAVGRLVTETLAFHRRAARDIGARLAEDDFALATAAQDAATLGEVTLGGVGTPLSNGMLKELFALGAPPQYQGFGRNLALAVRMLQIGSPAIVVETPTFDFHSGERVSGPPLYGYLGRTWAALRWLLASIPSGGGTLLDRTLVVTMSDFGRDKGGPTGYNGGEGTDHGADHGCYYLAHAVMGAGTTPGRLVGPVDTATYDARAEAIRYSPPQLLATLLDALGLDAADDAYGLPTSGGPIQELWS